MPHPASLRAPGPASIDRRAALGGGMALAVTLLSPGRSRAADADLPQPVAEAIAAVVGSRTPEDAGFTLSLPELSENGALVPVTVAVDSPMTAADHVRAIHLFATRNPTPGVGTYRLSPRAGKAEVQTRIRLASNQTVIALVELSDGRVLRRTAEVAVSVGGCVS